MLSVVHQDECGCVNRRYKRGSKHSESRENTATNGSQVTKCDNTDLIPAQRISTKQSETSAEQRDYNCGPEGEQDRMNA